MYRESKTNNSADVEVARPPSQCPACASPRVHTASKVITAATYWRCQSCGEVWNVGRRQAASRYAWR
jgi:transposase-like protein